MENILSVARGNSVKAKSMCMTQGPQAISAARALVTTVCVAHEIVEPKLKMFNCWFMKFSSISFLRKKGFLAFED